MKKHADTPLMLLTACMVMACTSENEFVPKGRWKVMERVAIYNNSDHPLTVKFFAEKGEVCAISEEAVVRKDLGYKKVSCAKGVGWTMTVSQFKKLDN